LVENNRWDRHGDRHRNRFPRIRGIDNFAGGSFTRAHQVRAYDRTNDEAFSQYASGTYFLRDQRYWDLSQENPIRLAPRAKIIHVDNRLDGDRYPPSDGCSYEHGVCVIRGGR
jgi:hypothetical protein